MIKGIIVFLKKPIESILVRTISVLNYTKNLVVNNIPFSVNVTHIPEYRDIKEDNLLANDFCKVLAEYFPMHCSHYFLYNIKSNNFYEADNHENDPLNCSNGLSLSSLESSISFEKGNGFCFKIEFTKMNSISNGKDVKRLLSSIMTGLQEYILHVTKTDCYDVSLQSDYPKPNCYMLSFRNKDSFLSAHCAIRDRSSTETKDYYNVFIRKVRDVSLVDKEESIKSEAFDNKLSEYSLEPVLDKSAISRVIL